MIAYATLAAFLASAAYVSAQADPTAPGPGDVFKQGGQCTFTWTPDPSGTWKETNVELMTGNNLQMVHITTVTTFDGTDPSKTTFSFDCPEVAPNSAIYFYQFSSPVAPENLTWTTRFTIAAADGSSTPPTEQKQPDGQAIPWGTGALVDPSKAVAAPSYLGSSESPTTGSGPSATGSATASGPGTLPPNVTSANTAPTSSSTSKLVTAPAPSSTATTNATSGQNASAATGQNGAVSMLGSDSYAVRAGVALGLAAFTFAFAL